MVFNGEFKGVCSEIPRVYGQPSPAFMVFYGEIKSVCSEIARVYGQPTPTPDSAECRQPRLRQSPSAHVPPIW